VEADPTTQQLKPIAAIIGGFLGSSLSPNPEVVTTNHHQRYCSRSASIPTLNA
jgi:hypothetical protein